MKNVIAQKSENNSSSNKLFLPSFIEVWNQSLDSKCNALFETQVKETANMHQFWIRGSKWNVYSQGWRGTANINPHCLFLQSQSLKIPDLIQTEVMQVHFADMEQELATKYSWQKRQGNLQEKETANQEHPEIKRVGRGKGLTDKGFAPCMKCKC